MNAKESTNRKPKLRLEGHDVSEMWRHAIAPGAADTDTLLVWARLTAGKAKATHLHDVELRSVVWFASLPLVEDKKGLEDAFFDEGNEFASAFFHVWLRDPDTVMRLLRLVRKWMAEPSQWRRVNKIKSDTKTSLLAASDAKIRRALYPEGDLKSAASKFASTFLPKKVTR